MVRSFRLRVVVVGSWTLVQEAILSPLTARSGYSISDDPFSPPMIANLGTVTPSSDQSRERVDIELFPWGAINGRFVDEVGDPVQVGRPGRPVDVRTAWS
jgi:hypothetical protein